MSSLLRTKAGGTPLTLSKSEPSQQCVLRVDWPASGGDIDAVAFVEEQSGEKHVLQPLDKNYGSLTAAPFVEHSGDQRAGGSEEIRFLNDPSLYRRILLWVFKYPNEVLASTQATATLTQPDGSQVVIDIDAAPRKTRGLVIAEITSDGQSLRVVPPPADKTYINPGWFSGPHQKIDDAFGWGFNWSAGSK
jgi:tellurite resistance protein TerA